MTPSLNISRFPSFSGSYLSYKPPSSQRRHFETRLQPTVNGTAQSSTLAAVKRPHKLLANYPLADKIILKDMNFICVIVDFFGRTGCGNCVIVDCLGVLRVWTVSFGGKNLLEQINR